MDNPILRGDAPLTYRIAPNPIARPRAREMGALLSPCHNPGVDENHDDGTDDEPGKTCMGLRADHVDGREACVGLASLAVDLP